MEFYEDHKGKIFSYLMRMTAGDYDLSQDIMQESYTRYLEHYGMENRSISLLYTIARNTIIDHERRFRYRQPIGQDHKDTSISQEAGFMVREEYRRVLSAFQGLEKNERDILTLVVSGDVSYRQIASIIGISEANVKVKVHRARIKLKRILEEGDI
ncbi:MAG: RNA polymerase sigma factor [Deltaproteobacteria bacterium]|nr:RNA polymerase sigma factor [Deltaproteobacteria bacterium]